MIHTTNQSLNKYKFIIHSNKNVLVDLRFGCDETKRIARENQGWKNQT